MNIKEYISSGIIESYVLGLATEAERTEFESVCAQYPEVAAARTAFELSLEEQLLQDAVAPPQYLKAAIGEKLSPGNTATAAPGAERETPVRSMGIWKWIAAASLLLLAGTAFWAFQTQGKYKDLQAAHTNLQRQFSDATAQASTIKSDMALLQKPEVKMAALQGTEQPGMYSTVYWDTATRDVYLMINNLPQPAGDKQYQLWALLNNQPIDLGTIEVTQQRLLYRMKNVRDAQAFAITLEPKGGSQAPTSKPIVMAGL